MKGYPRGSEEVSREAAQSLCAGTLRGDLGILLGGPGDHRPGWSFQGLFVESGGILPVGAARRRPSQLSGRPNLGNVPGQDRLVLTIADPLANLAKFLHRRVFKTLTLAIEVLVNLQGSLLEKVMRFAGAASE